MITVADQTLMPLAGEQGDAVHTSVVLNQWQVMDILRLRLDSKASQSRQG